MRGKVTDVNEKEILLENILAATSGMVFSQKTAVKIVGGKGKLLALIADGKIDCTKDNGSQNGKWFCNAAQVLSHCRNMRPNKSRRSQTN